MLNYLTLIQHPKHSKIFRGSWSQLSISLGHLLIVGEESKLLSKWTLNNTQAWKDIENLYTTGWRGQWGSPETYMAVGICLKLSFSFPLGKFFILYHKYLNIILIAFLKTRIQSSFMHWILCLFSSLKFETVVPQFHKIFLNLKKWMAELEN